MRASILRLAEYISKIYMYMWRHTLVAARRAAWKRYDAPRLDLIFFKASMTMEPNVRDIIAK